MSDLIKRPPPFATNHLFGSHRRGLITFLLVLVVGSVLTLAAVVSLLLATSGSQISQLAERGLDARTNAETCAEETLEAIRLDPNYGLSGPITITLPNGSCIITVTAPVAGGRSLAIQGTIADSTRRLAVTVSLSNGAISLLTWREVN